MTEFPFNDVTEPTEIEGVFVKMFLNGTRQSSSTDEDHFSVYFYVFVTNREGFFLDTRYHDGYLGLNPCPEELKEYSFVHALQSLTGEYAPLAGQPIRTLEWEIDELGPITIEQQNLVESG